MQDRPRDVRVDEPRPRRAERLLCTGARHSSSDMAVRLLPHQLDRPRPGRQPAGLRAQHLGRLRHRRAAPGRSRGGSAASTAASAMGPGTSTAWQHDPRELADGAISIFDNGASPTVHSQSRGDRRSASNPQQRTATLVSQLTHPRRCSPTARATSRRWPTATGSSAGARSRTSPSSAPPARCCSTPTSRAGDESYRAFRFAWTGTPAHPPAFAVQPGARRRGHRLRELERRHAGGGLAGAGGRRRRARLQPVAQRRAQRL